MALDKELYRWALEQYKEWNEAELTWRARNRGLASPGELLEQYSELVAFCYRLLPEGSLERLRERKHQEWSDYYERIRLFEERRGTLGRAALSSGDR